jgi:hypothetical protein
MRPSCIVIAVAIACGGLAAPAEAQQNVNADAQVLAEFRKRIEGYMDLRRRVQRDLPKLESTEHPADITAARERLAAAIRSARADAAHGDIFTEDVSAVFRRLLSDETTGPEAADTRRAIAEDAPAKISLKVNASYPEGQPLPTVPPNVLANLPRLPEGLEYRIVQRHLILRDVDANLIVDTMSKAIP